MATTKHSLKVFLCHAHTDLTVVRALYARLTKDGMDVWLDKEKILPGQHWSIEKISSVKKSDVVIVCLSKQSMSKEGLFHREIALALEIAKEKPEGAIFVIPLRLEECDVLPQLRQLGWGDLFEPDGYERLINALRAREKQINARDSNP